MTDHAAHPTTNTYDALDRLTRVTYADGNFIENTYDAAGRLIAVKDERGNTTTHEYDKARRVMFSGSFRRPVWTQKGNTLRAGFGPLGGLSVQDRRDAGWHSEWF